MFPDTKETAGSAMGNSGHYGHTHRTEMWNYKNKRCYCWTKLKRKPSDEKKHSLKQPFYTETTVCIIHFLVIHTCSKTYSKHIKYAPSHSLSRWNRCMSSQSSKISVTIHLLVYHTRKFLKKCPSQTQQTTKRDVETEPMNVISCWDKTNECHQFKWNMILLQSQPSCILLCFFGE